MCTLGIGSGIKSHSGFARHHNGSIRVWLADCPAWWVLSEPFDNHSHVLLKAAGHRNIQHTGAHTAPVLKIMGGSSRCEDKRVFRAIDPFPINEETLASASIMRCTAVNRLPQSSATVLSCGFGGYFE